jgi:hypothetical protein
MKEMACMLVPSLEEMKFTLPSLKEPPKLFNHGAWQILLLVQVVEDIVGIEIGGGSKRGVRGTCRQHFPSFQHILVLYHSFFFCKFQNLF